VSTLYVVGAPEGDPADSTLRAVRILGQAAHVVTNDVVRARSLLNQYHIDTPLSGAGVAAEIMDEGDIALLISGNSPSGAGPAQRLVQAAHERGLSVVPVPGPSLPITALVVSGLPADGFVYLGRLPSQTIERRHLLASVTSERRTLIIQEELAHLTSTLSDLSAALGNRPLCIMTASDTQNMAVYRGILSEASADPLDLPGDGPLVLIIGGHRRARARWSEEQIRAELRVRLEAGQPAKEIARSLAAESGWPRREIYRMAVDGTQESS
jgi:16S rRNA (cytidine1402-2'-O)-methyltransferase